ncbi:hypothetical protein ACHAXR_011941 [Thalassiosira sp. AJA248-18]
MAGTVGLTYFLDNCHFYRLGPTGQLALHSADTVDILDHSALGDVMSSTTRHLHRRNLAAADTVDIDHFRDEQRSLASDGRRARATKRRTQPSTAVLDALSDETSDLARFLLMGKESDGLFARFRRAVAAGVGDDNGDAVMTSMGTFNGDAYCLALEPMEVRSEKIVQLAEAYAIFGGLFLGGTWVLYEWGSPLSFGGESTADTEVHDRLFAAVMAIAICCNIFLALWSSVLWINAIVYGSREGFVFEARRCLSYLQGLLLTTVYFTTSGIFLGIYGNLRPNVPETIAVMVFAGVIHLAGVKHANDFQYKVSPLTVYHMPKWFQALGYPLSVFTQKGRQKLQERAKNDANNLKSKAFHDRGIADPGKGRVNDKDIGILLQTAAINLGRTDYDISTVEDRLEQDWFNEVNQLKGMSVDFLSRYMPYRLAKEMHNLVEAECSEGGS